MINGDLAFWLIFGASAGYAAVLLFVVIGAAIVSLCVGSDD